MKKADIVTLIRCYAEKDDAGFKNKANDIANEFSQEGDSDIASYIASLFSNTNAMVPQSKAPMSDFFKQVPISKSPLYLPNSIRDDLFGIVNAASRNMGVNRFLFYGCPGSGKTESAHQVARMLSRQLCVVDFNNIIDAKLGQTAKNIALLFAEINSYELRDKTVFLFDEIDSLALDRINSNDVREMGRATSEFLKGLDEVNKEAVIIATTNLYGQLDKALIRRFDFSVDFSRYSKDDLLSVDLSLYNEITSRSGHVSSNIKLFRKMLNLSPSLLYPGNMRNLLFSAIAFSSLNDPNDYLRRIWKGLNGNEQAFKPKDLIEKGFTLREAEILTGTPKSTLGRIYKDERKRKQ